MAGPIQTLSEVAASPDAMAALVPLAILCGIGFAVASALTLIFARMLIRSAAKWREKAEPTAPSVPAPVAVSPVAAPLVATTPSLAPPAEDSSGLRAALTHAHEQLSAAQADRDRLRSALENERHQVNELTVRVDTLTKHAHKLDSQLSTLLVEFERMYQDAPPQEIPSDAPSVPEPTPVPVSSEISSPGPGAITAEQAKVDRLRSILSSLANRARK